MARGPRLTRGGVDYGESGRGFSGWLRRWRWHVLSTVLGAVASFVTPMVIDAIKGL